MRRPRMSPPHWHAELDMAAIRRLVLEVRNEGAAVRRRDQFPRLPELRRAIQAELDRVTQGQPDLPHFTAEISGCDLIVRIVRWKRPETPIPRTPLVEP